MIDFREITLEDQNCFTQIFSSNHSVSSEYTFPYLFMWRRDYNLRYSIVGNYLCLISNSRVAISFAFCPVPISGVHEKDGFEKALEAIASQFREKGHDLAFGRVEEDKIPLFKDYYQGRAQFEYLPDASDYVYESADLIQLTGKKFSGKRNHISQFKRYYSDYEYISLSAENLNECKQIFEDWCQKNETECLHPDNCERLACFELLDNWEILNLKGALVKVNGRSEAFTIGELLNKDMAVIRVEKGNSDIHGIYTFINREFCEKEWSGQRLINREEDMGKEGLKKAKLSYYPTQLINKYMVRVST